MVSVIETVGLAVGVGVALSCDAIPEKENRPIKIAVKTAPLNTQTQIGNLRPQCSFGSRAGIALSFCGAASLLSCFKGVPGLLGMAFPSRTGLAGIDSSTSVESGKVCSLKSVAFKGTVAWYSLEGRSLPDRGDGSGPRGSVRLSVGLSRSPSIINTLLREIASSSAVLKRKSRSFAIAWSITDCRSLGNSGLASRMFGTGSMRIIFMSWVGIAASYGSRPVSIWNKITPKE